MHVLTGGKEREKEPRYTSGRNFYSSFEEISLPGNFCSEIEGTFVNLSQLQLAIFCLYRPIPPDLKAAKLLEAKEAICSVVDLHCMSYLNQEIIVVGDFNRFDVKSLESELFLTDIVSKPTRGPNILDHVLISEKLKAFYSPSTVSYNAPIGNSDHLTLQIETDCKNISTQFGHIKCAISANRIWKC